MIDLHRHDEYSTFDGFGKADELAKIAKELGHTGLAITNHGNMNSAIKTYQACNEVGIKPVIGIEGYFLPVWKEKTKGYHLCLFAKNLQGYKNLNKIQFEGEKQKFYNSIWDFEILEKYKDGIICSSACVASYSSQAILNNEFEKAKKYLLKMKQIFGEDFYLEVQPYKVTEPEMQEKVNYYLIKFSKELKIKCILTSDSHRGRKDELSTYMKMHQIAGHNNMDIEEQYGDRYMPTEKEIKDRFIQMHSKGKYKVENAERLANEMIKNIDEIDNKIENKILEGLELKLPKISNVNKSSDKLFINLIKEGLKRRGKFNKQYIDRCKEEYEVIKSQNLEDYFLIVYDYVKYAKDSGIAVGPGRGSVCNSLIAYALGITEVDSLLFKLDFRRFIRIDKKKLPDIDLDFETSRRQEVIEYLMKKYEGHVSQICSYGLYKVDNLVNDLAKVCRLEITGDDVDENDIKVNKQIITNIKSLINSYIDEDYHLLIDELLNDNEAKGYNKKYDNIILHFTKLFKKVRFIGTHAAGVAITGGNILDYTTIRIDKNGKYYSAYDLMDLESINIVKFDILGLSTMESISDLRKMTGVTVNYDEIVNDKKLIDEFRKGNTYGIFQVEKKAAINILSEIETNNFEDVVATSAMNRPGPLSLKMPKYYAENKKNIGDSKNTKWYKYTKETYGTIIYQEQVQQICINIANMSWGDADKIMKLMKGSSMTEKAIQMYENNKNELMKIFVDGAIKNGLNKSEAKELFEKMIAYTFNRGHALGYTLITMEEMFYKIYYPTEFWYAKMKFAKDDIEYSNFCSDAVKNNIVVFLPHVNYSKSKTSIRKVDGEESLQQGLSDLKNVGEKAALEIEEERKKNGIFKSYDDFIDRCKSRVVTTRVISVLKENGALDFNKKLYINKVMRYNSSLYARSMK